MTNIEQGSVGENIDYLGFTRLSIHLGLLCLSYRLPLVGVKLVLLIDAST